MRVKKKMLGIILSLVLVLGLMPWMSLTAKADATLSNLWIGDSEEITSEGVVNDTGGTGTASVTVDGNDIVITLTDFVYSGVGNSCDNFLSGITYNGDYNLRVELVGNNTITQTGNNGGNCAGFYSWKSGSVSFCGSGSLIVSGGNAQSNSFGISVGGPLSIEECTITATSGNVTQYASAGIAAGGDINVFNADVTASCGTTSGSAYCNGIQAFSYSSGPKKLVIMSGNVEVTGISSALYYANDSYRTQMILSDGHGSVLSLQAGENEAGATDVTVENVANQKYVSIKTERILHTHDFTYSATGATITATCTDNCDIADGLTLTISAPTELTYDGSAKAASLSTGYNTTAFPDEYTIKYYQGASEVEAANVKAAGDYTAKVTVGDATASVDFIIVKANSAVTKAPEAKELAYNGQAQELVTAGIAEGGEMQYSLGTKDAATGEYSTSIPTATKAGTYYVWYKVVGDSNHLDSDVGYVTVTIATVDSSDSANTDTSAKVPYDDVPISPGSVNDITGTAAATAESNPFGTKIENNSNLTTLLSLTDEEVAQGVNVWLDIQDMSASVSQTDKTLIQNTSGDYTVGLYLDINLFKKVGSNDATKVTETNGKVKASIVIPESLWKSGRTFEIIRVHDGVATAIEGTYDENTHVFTFETDKFSTYALAYKDSASSSDSGTTSNSSNSTQSTSPKTGDSNDVRVWYLLLIASLGGLGFLGLSKKKEN